MMFELTVIVKGEDQILRKKFLMYENYIELNHNDEILKEAVEKTVKDFNGDPDSVKIRINMEWS